MHFECRSEGSMSVLNRSYQSSTQFSTTETKVFVCSSEARRKQILPVILRSMRDKWLSKQTINKGTGYHCSQEEEPQRRPKAFEHNIRLYAVQSRWIRSVFSRKTRIPVAFDSFELIQKQIIRKVTKLQSTLNC